jgi:hypothetical protein
MRLGCANDQFGFKPKKYISEVFFMFVRLQTELNFKKYQLNKLKPNEIKYQKLQNLKEK